MADHLLVPSMIGFVVGGLVGLTGLGGGVVLLPSLILFMGIPPLVTVGSGALFSALTKSGAAVLHWRQRTVDWRLAIGLLGGSIPGAAAGVGLLSILTHQYGTGIDLVLKKCIAVLLVIIPLLLVIQGILERRWGRGVLRHHLPTWINRDLGAVIAGLAGGLLVGLTSVGSGSIIMLMLLLFFRRPASVLVGTDIVHAAVLMGVTAALHYPLGTVDPALVAVLLAGALPGVFLGVRLGRRFPLKWLRAVLIVLVMTAGIHLLVGTP